MAFDLATARPVDQQQPAAAPAPAARFDPATARPGLGLQPQQPVDQIPGVDPQWAAGQAPAQLEEQRRAQYAAENPVVERVRGAIEGALDIVAKIGGGTVGGLLGLASAPFTDRTAEESFGVGAQAGVEGVRKGYGILGLPGAQGPTTATGAAISEGLDTALQNLPPVVGVHGTLAAPALNTGAAVRQVAAPVVDAARRGLDAAGGAAARVAEAVPGLRRDHAPPAAVAESATLPKTERVAKDERTRLAQKATEYGIPLRPDMLSDNRLAKFVGDTLEKVPLSGSKAPERQRAFNRAVMDQLGADSRAEVLTPDVFDEAMSRAGQEIGDVYEKTPVPAESLGDLESVARRETPDVQQVIRAYSDDLRQIADENGGIVPGEQLRKMRTEAAQQARGSTNGDLRRTLGDLVDRMDDALEQHAASGDMERLSNARRRYAVAKTLEDLVAKSVHGNISPAALMGRVTADRAGKARMARGQGGELGELARIGQAFLKEPPSSGTGERLGAYGVVGGGAVGAAFSPDVITGAVVANLAANAYNRIGPKLVKARLGRKGVVAETKPPARGTKGGAGGTEPAAGGTPSVPDDPRLQEIARLKVEQAGSPETVRVLEAQEKRIGAEIRAGKAAARRETEADALERAAASTFEPAVRQSLLARANELRGAKLPVGQATELREVPVAKPERTGKIPVGEAKELPAAAAEPTKPVPAGQAAELTPDQAAALKPTRRERDLLRLRDEATDPEIVSDLDREITAERQRAANERRGAEYLRLADAATDPEVRAAMESKAKKLGATRPAADEKIPVPEATELDVQTVEPSAPAEVAPPAAEAPLQLPDAELSVWAKRWGFGSLDAQAARDVREAMRYDAAAVEQAAQQHARSPGPFTRALQRIIEEGKARESETQRPGGSGEGSDRPGTGLRGEDGGSQEGDGGTPVEPGSGRPRAPDGPGGGAGAARPSEELGPTARAQAKAREGFDEATKPTGNPITDRFSEKLRADYEGARREYDALEDSRGGLVLNTDTARELSPDYLADRTRSADVHEPASAFIKRVYADRLAAETPQGKERAVMFTGGGTGAGKTTGLKQLGDAVGRPEIIYDTNMNGLTSSIAKIEQALAAGRDVRLMYVYADPVQAFDQAISRTLSQKAKFGSGRTVPIAEHAKTHVGASRVIRDLVDRYRNDLRVDFYFVDNSRGRGGAVRANSVADLPLVSENGLREQLEAIAREARRSGRIDDATLAGYLGEPAAGVWVEGLERGVPSPVQRPGAGGQPGSRGQEARLTASPPAAAPAQPAPLPGPVGSSTSVVTERGLRVPVRYRLISVADLITSHSDDLKVNPAFPQLFQPRDRTRASSEAQITRMQNALQPELLADGPKASDGAPIVGPDGLVESGNARTIAVRRAYGTGQAEGYRQWLEQHAERFGLTAEQVRAVDRPVLVRERTTDVDRAEFARQANESAVAAMSESEQAFADAPQLPDLEKLVTNDDGTVNARASAGFIREFMHLVASPAERGQLMTADGAPSQRLLSRIRNAVFARAYGDADLVARMAEATDGNTRNLLGGLMRGAPEVARLRSLADAGARPPAEFVPDLVEAARRYTALRQDGMTVSQSLSQGDMLGGGPSDRVASLMREMEVNARAQRRIAEMVERLTNEVDSQGDPRQQGLGL